MGNLKITRTRVTDNGWTMEVEIDGEWRDVLRDPHDVLIEQGIVAIDWPAGDRESVPYVLAKTRGGRIDKIARAVRHQGLAERVRRFEAGRDGPDLVPGGPPVDLAPDPDSAP